MTGFARRQGHDDRCSWTWELRSVNHRGFDIRVRLPQGNETLEPALRKAVASRLRRGSVFVSLLVKNISGARKTRVNRPLLVQMLMIVRELAQERDLEPPRVEGLLGVPGVIETLDEDEAVADVRRAAMMDDLTHTLDDLIEDRRREGARLELALAASLDEIVTLTADAARLAIAQPEAVKQNLAARIAEILDASAELPQERLMQEVALLASKSDVREEIDRLQAHAEAARKLLGESGPIGRRLDFLCQELNREANTLSAKSGDIALIRLALDLKTSIDQLREQAQNIE